LFSFLRVFEKDTKPLYSDKPLYLNNILCRILTLRIQVCPKKGTISTILVWGWDFYHTLGIVLDS